MKLTTIDTGIEANTDAWLEARKACLTASNIADVIGIGYKTWEEVRNGEPEQFTQEQLRRFGVGHAFEMPLKQMWATEGEGRQLLPTPSTLWLCNDGGVPVVGATPDGFAIDENGERCLLEVKTVGYRMAKKWADGPPLNVLLQVQAQMMCTDYEWCCVIAAIGGPSYEEWKIQADPNMQRLIRDVAAACNDMLPSAELQAVWLRQLDAMGHKQDVSKLWPSVLEGEAAEAGEDLASRLRAAHLAREDAKAVYDAVVKEAQRYMMGAEFLTNGGEIVATWKQATRKYLDKNAVMAVVPPEAMDALYKTNSSRSFLVKIAGVESGSTM